jgi:TolB-like protein
MRKQTFLVPVLWLAAAALLQAEPLSVAVYDFTAVGESMKDVDHGNKRWNASKWNALRETTHDLGLSVTALVTADLAAQTNLVLVERSDLAKALNEQALDLSGMVNADTAAKIGQVTGAKILVTGQIIKTGDDSLVLVADVIGTETGRLFADKVQGPASDIGNLTDALGEKISQTIEAQATNLVATSIESHSARLERIVKSINGTNRPSVSITIYLPNGVNKKTGKRLECWPVETEIGDILLKAGFPVADDNSDRKPDIQIVGVSDVSAGPRRGSLVTFDASLEVKVQDRRSGKIIAFERQESTATDVGGQVANRLARSNSADDLMEKILPLLAK